MKIMISLDGSQSSLRAIEFITTRPWAEGDQFLIVSVAEPDRGDVSIGQAICNPDEVFVAEAEKLLATAKRRLESHTPNHVVETSVLNGPVVESLLDCAKAYSADLMIMGSEGRKGLDRLLLGSVAEAVLRGAPCSVQIVRRKLA